MSLRTRSLLCVFGVLASLAVPTAMVFVYGPGLMRTWNTPRKPILPDTRSPAEKLAAKHSFQIGILARHRQLFEAAARDEPGKRRELLDTVEDVRIVGIEPIEFEWRVGSGHFSYAYKLIWCPNGERDLPTRFWEGSYSYSEPMKIDDHWFAAYEPSG